MDRRGPAKRTPIRVLSQESDPMFHIWVCLLSVPPSFVVSFKAKPKGQPLRLLGSKSSKTTRHRNPEKNRVRRLPREAQLQRQQRKDHLQRVVPAVHEVAVEEEGPGLARPKRRRGAVPVKGARVVHRRVSATENSDKGKQDKWADEFATVGVYGENGLIPGVCACVD